VNLVESHSGLGSCGLACDVEALHFLKAICIKRRTKEDKLKDKIIKVKSKK